MKPKSLEHIGKYIQSSGHDTEESIFLSEVTFCDGEVEFSASIKKEANHYVFIIGDHWWRFDEMIMHDDEALELRWQARITLVLRLKKEDKNV